MAQNWKLKRAHGPSPATLQALAPVPHPEADCLESSSPAHFPSGVPLNCRLCEASKTVGRSLWGGGGDNQDSRPTWLVPGRGSGHAVWTGPLLARSWPFNIGNSDSLAEGRPMPFCCCFLGLLSVRFLWYCSLFPRLSLQLQMKVVIDECLFIPVMFCPLGSKYVHLRQETVFVF